MNPTEKAFALRIYIRYAPRRGGPSGQHSSDVEQHRVVSIESLRSNAPEIIAYLSFNRLRTPRTTAMVHSMGRRIAVDHQSIATDAAPFKRWAEVVTFISQK